MSGTNQRINIFENLTCTVKEIQQMSLTGTDKALENRWAWIAELIDPVYCSWRVRGNLTETVTANRVEKGKWQFVRVVLVLKNQGSKEETINLCTADLNCPRVDIVTPSGTVIPVWEFKLAGMYPSPSDLKTDMESHAAGVVRHGEFKGDLYVNLAPEQSTWIAVLFKRTGDLGKCSLRVFDKILPVVIRP